MPEPVQHDPDLFQPSLTGEHDIDGIHEPYNPRTFLYLAFFFGPVAAGIPLFLNARRLGMKPGAGGWALVVSVLFLVIWYPIMIPLVVKLARESDMDKITGQVMDYAKRGGDADGIVKETERLVKEQKESSTTLKDYKTYGRWICQALSVVVAWPFVRAQRQRFRLAQMHDLPPGKLLWPGIAACAISLVASFVAASCAGLVFLRR